jgi:hypothetical protein
MHEAKFVIKEETDRDEPIYEIKKSKNNTFPEQFHYKNHLTELKINRIDL